MGQLVEIRHFYDPMEAYCAKGYLESHGFTVLLQGEHHQGVEPYLRVALGGMRLLVPESEADEIRTLLNELDRRSTAPGSSEIRPRTCNVCGGTEFKTVKDLVGYFIAILGMVFIGAGAGPRRKGWPVRCLNCGHRQSALDG